MSVGSIPVRVANAGVAAACVALLLAACAHRVAAQSGGAPPNFPPGRLVDVGGWRLHLHCTGERLPGQPLIILEAGLGDFSVEWALVQPGIARVARTCSYDRAGDGWSDLGPHPRSMRQIALELHVLLEVADEPPPFVLVGHSYGGLLARVFHQTYPADVVGLVLVDPGLDDPWRLTPDGLIRSSAFATGRPVPLPRMHSPLRIEDIPPDALARMRAGLDDAARLANAPPRDRLPGDAQRMRAWALGRVEHVAAAVNPFEHEELAILRARTAADASLAELPLVVITRGRPEVTGPEGRAIEDDHRRAHAELAARSRRGSLRLASHSGHHVQLEQPALVIAAVVDLVAVVH